MSLAQGNNTPTRPRIEPGSPKPESDALTTRPVRSTLFNFRRKGLARLRFCIKFYDNRWISFIDMAFCIHVFLNMSMAARHFCKPCHVTIIKKTLNNIIILCFALLKRVKITYTFPRTWPVRRNLNSAIQKIDPKSNLTVDTDYPEP